jgi:flagellar protein FliJ
MKRFSFRLERLLQIREAEEREQARALGLALREEEACRLRALASEERLADARAQYLATPGDLSQAGTLRNLELALGGLEEEFRTLTDTHEASLARLDAERQRFDQARMARRVLERLREQRRDAWETEVARLEQGASDEAAGQRQTTSREPL